MSRPATHPDHPHTERALLRRVIARVGAAVFGGYAFAWGLIAAATSALFAAGLEFHDAEFLANAMGLLAYLVALLWAFTVRSVVRSWLVLVGSGALMAAGASLLKAALV